MEDSSMKMILKHILNTSVLLLTGIVFAGCSSSDAPIEQPINPAGKYTMTVNASKGSDATTRALSIDGEGKLIAYWDGTEKVTVKEGTTTLGTLTVTPNATDNTEAKLSGKLDVAPSGTSLTLELCSPTYGSQDGTLAYIASNCDYATATTTVTYDDVNKTITGSYASFTNQQAIVKFTLQNAKGESLAFDNLKVSTTGDITITPASATDVIYAALSGVDNNTVTLTATKGLDTYTCIAKNVTFENGKYYRVTAKMRPEPLTFEWAGEDCTVFFSDYKSTLQYSYDKVTWKNYSTGITLSSTHPIVYFHGMEATKYGVSETTTIYCSKDDEIADKMGKCKVYGNIMSLIDPDPTKFVTLTKLPGTDVFHNLFYGNTNIINDDTKDIVLPATTLTAYCYYAMFFGCTGLTRAPVLPAPTLTDHCYHAMFSGCSSLAYIKCLATDINATSCTTDWVYDVKNERMRVRVPLSRLLLRRIGRQAPRAFLQGGLLLLNNGKNSSRYKYLAVNS